MPPRPTSSPSLRARSALLALCVVAVAVLAGCRTEARVHVAVGEDGSGTVTVTVTIDREAADQLGDPSAVALDDLRQAGWRATDARPHEGGLRWVLRRNFSSPEDLSTVLGEVGGAAGVFRGVRLTVTDGLASTKYHFRTRVELSGSLDQFSDPELADALGGVPVGWIPEELALVGADRAEAGRLVLTVELPGGKPATDGEVVGGLSRWEYPITGGRPTSEVATASSTNGSALPWVLAGIGVVLLGGAVVVAAASWLRNR